MDFNLSQEGTTGAGDAQKQEDKRGDGDGVYANFDGGENDDEDTGPPDDEFQRGDPPIGVNLSWWGDKISDSVDDDRGNAGGGDPVESRCQTIESDDDTDGCEDAGDWGPDARLGLECRTGERTGGRVGSEAGSDSVCDADGDQFLVGVNLIVVDASEC